jgi:hypothetical protein
MSKDPAFLFYPADWTLGTIHMTLLEKGAYMELLMLQFAKGKFTLAHAKHMLGICFDEVWHEVGQKFETDGTYYWNKRLAEEQAKRSSYSESRRLNALNPKKEVEHMHEHMPKHMGDINTNTNDVLILNMGFENFWNLYDKKVDRIKCEKKWAKLTGKDKDRIMEHLPEYIMATPDKKFRRDPATYLNNRSWDNEIIEANGGNKKNNSGATAEQLASLLANKLGSDRKQ